MNFNKIIFLFLIGILAFSSCKKDDDNTPDEDANIVVEVTTFNLNTGVDANAFEVRDTEIEQDFASQQPGFLKRMSGVDANGKYVIMVFWETLEDADASIAAFGADPTVADYFGMINESTFSAERFTTFSVPDISFSLAAQNVIEITTFNLNTGVDADAFADRDAEIEQDFASQQPGFIRRTSGVDADGKYAVIVFWETLADADASIAAFQIDPTVADYFAMIDGNTFLAERYAIFEAMPQIPSNLTIDDNVFFPEDITIINNRVFLSGLGDGTIRTFDLTETNATAQLFATAETGYAQSWGLKSNGSVVLNLLNNVDFSFATPPGASKLIQYDMNGTKTAEWDLPANTIGHTVSIVDGKYYVTDFGNPRIIEVDPTTGNVNDSWFTSPQWDPSVDGNVGGTIYDGSAGFYAYLGFKFWYIPISNGQAGTMQEVNISGLSSEQINADGITWGADQNTLYYSSNDTSDPADAGTVYKLEFSNATTATGSIVTTGLDDVSGIWYLENNGSEYLFMCESQFGGLFGINSFDPPFNIEVINL